ncbi:MAG: cysteine synthase A [Clostridia bacterium]|nr:cysteine synthase A [Clostridia bacterium]
MKIFNSLDALIGNTPLFRANNIEKAQELNARLLLKLESFNPAGSVKDRAALFMLKDAEEKGNIRKGSTIIEPTSGNTGIGLASLCASRGYKVILTMPETMSKERIKLLKAYGAEVVLTDGKKGIAGAVEKANELKEKIPGSFIPSQFKNPANAQAHYLTTAREIWEDTDGKIDIFVAGMGSGGTISGCGKYLKEQNRNIQVVAVEPKSSPLISENKAGAHKIQGIGANFIPDNFNKAICDSVITVTDEEAYLATRFLVKSEGILAGISSGASLSAGIRLAKMPENQGKTIVVLLPDTGERYLSVEGLFE